MKNQRPLIALVILALFVFNIIFWKEGLGINLLIFTILSVPSLFYCYPAIRENRKVLFFGISTIILSALVVINHSLLSMVMYFISYLILLGFSFYNHEHQVLVAGVKGLSQIVMGPFRNIGLLSDGIREHLPFRRFFYYLKIILIPLVIILLFLFLYSTANEIVSSYTENFFKHLGNFFKKLNAQRIFFFAFSFICVSATMVAPNFFDDSLKTVPVLKKIIARQKRSRKDFAPHNQGMVNLKKEYRIAQLSLIGLNLLILFVNFIDITTVWIGDPAANQVHLKTFVHQGTYILIISILIAMSLLIVFFRKNLNFLPNNKSLKLLAYAWVIQNAIMVVSVFIRNFTYIQWHGLAYKRIGVMIFLLLTLFGLWTMFQKVRSKHSLKYLISKNSLAVFVALLLCCTINWDAVITKYNLENQFYGEIDLKHMIYWVSDKNYYILKKHEDRLAEIPTYPSIPVEQMEIGIYEKKNRITRGYKNRSWLSWNLPYLRNMKYIEGEIE